MNAQMSCHMPAVGKGAVTVRPGAGKAPDVGNADRPAAGLCPPVAGGGSRYDGAGMRSAGLTTGHTGSASCGQRGRGCRWLWRATAPVAKMVHCGQAIAMTGAGYPPGRRSDRGRNTLVSLAVAGCHEPLPEYVRVAEGVLSLVGRRCRRLAGR